MKTKKIKANQLRDGMTVRYDGEWVKVHDVPERDYDRNPVEFGVEDTIVRYYWFRPEEPVEIQVDEFVVTAINESIADLIAEGELNIMDDEAEYLRDVLSEPDVDQGHVLNVLTKLERDVIETIFIHADNPEAFKAAVRFVNAMNEDNVQEEANEMKIQIKHKFLKPGRIVYTDDDVRIEVDRVLRASNDESVVVYWDTDGNLYSANEECFVTVDDGHEFRYDDTNRQIGWMVSDGNLSIEDDEAECLRDALSEPGIDQNHILDVLKNMSLDQRFTLFVELSLTKESLIAAFRFLMTIDPENLPYHKR